MLVEVAADLIDTINTFWYDPFVLNKKSNDTKDEDFHHDTVPAYQGHEDYLDHEDHDSTNQTGHEQPKNGTQNETYDLDYNEDYYNGT